MTTSATCCFSLSKEEGVSEMNKTELIKKVSMAASVNKKTAKKAIDSVIGEIASSLGRGESVMFQGFGTFTVIKRSPRIGNNLRTGESIQIPAHKTPVFRPADKLKKSVK
jgi:DNA-binding protein HU-beta